MLPVRLRLNTLSWTGPGMRCSIYKTVNLRKARITAFSSLPKVVAVWMLVPTKEGCSNATQSFLLNFHNIQKAKQAKPTIFWFSRAPIVATPLAAWMPFLTQESCFNAA